MRQPAGGCGSGSGSGTSCMPPAEFALFVSAWIQRLLSIGCLLPKYSKASGMLGLIQIDLRPEPFAAVSLHVKEKLSPRRPFAQITTCRCARTRSSKVADNLESYV